MKNLIFLGFLMLLCLGSKAQNPDFPDVKYKIFLKSGKTINEVKLWNIDSAKVEYLSNGNLNDIITSEISDIETPEFYIVFDSNYHYHINKYDIIIDYKNIESKGRITIIDSFYITYFPYDKIKQRTVSYKSYIIKNSNPSSILMFNPKDSDKTYTNISDNISKDSTSNDENITKNPDNKKTIDKKSDKYKKFNKGCGIAVVTYISLNLIIYLLAIFL